MCIYVHTHTFCAYFNIELLTVRAVVPANFKAIAISIRVRRLKLLYDQSLKVESDLAEIKY